jgi:hypothetical protein
LLACGIPLTDERRFAHNWEKFVLRNGKAPGFSRPGRHAAHEKLERRGGGRLVLVSRSQGALGDRGGGGLGSDGGEGTGVAGVAVFDALGEGVEGNVVVVADFVRGDGSGVHGAVEDPPAAFMLPHDPGVGDASVALHFADDEAGAGILELVAEPEGLVFAIADFASGGFLGRSGVVGIGVGVAEAAAFAHERVDAIHGDVLGVEGIEDALYGSHVSVVGGGGGGGAEIDGGGGGEFGEEEESEREDRDFHGSMFIRISIILISAMRATSFRN